jgi:hypothetical protein
MKKISTLLLIIIAILASSESKAQVLLNEIYAEPNSNTHEFFEFYNSTGSDVAVSMDNYTLISYFEDGNTKGFYVLNMPALSIPSKGYFVGASSIPFNYQGNTGATSANFSWNDPSLASNHGYIKKWVLSTNNANDGNSFYDEYPVPANFNDFFSRKSGSGASYNAMVFKDGELVNNFFGGTGGNTGFPQYITSMPGFQLENLTATGTVNHTISFSSLSNRSTEYVTQDIGSDNGFMRTRDGFCGTWGKSSTTSFHTPGAPNTSSSTASATLTLNAHLYPGTSSGEQPFIVYDVVAGPASAFPVVLQVYLDNGNVPGQIDAQDTYVTSNTETSLSSGPFSTTVPVSVNVLIIAKTEAGCIDQIRSVLNTIEAIALPVQIKQVKGSNTNNQNHLQWTVSENHRGSYFEVQRSTDGKNFEKVAVISNTRQHGDEAYRFSEPGLMQTCYYRIKILNKDHSYSLSEMVSIKPTSSTVQQLILNQNPVQHSLWLSYETDEISLAAVSIVSFTGAKLLSKNIQLQKGRNTLSLPLDSNLPAGTYLLNISNGKQNASVKFLKQ